VSWGPTHGYGVARWIEQATADVLRIEEGSLYPALHRLEARGWIASDWGTSENNRRAKFYTITTKGRAQFRAGGLRRARGAPPTAMSGAKKPSPAAWRRYARFWGSNIPEDVDAELDFH